MALTLNAPIATKVICFSRLLKCLRSLYGKQCGPRSDCSYRSSLFWVHTVCFYILFVSNVRQLFAADNFSGQHLQMHFFSWRLKGLSPSMFTSGSPRWLTRVTKKSSSDLKNSKKHSTQWLHSKAPLYSIF